MPKSKVTRHGINRGGERTGLSPAAFVHLAEKALNEGLQHKDCTGTFKRFIDKLFLYNRTANNIRIYGEFVYIFSGHTLITVYHLPNHFKTLVKKLKRK